jgi:hypothetical protein
MVAHAAHGERPARWATGGKQFGQAKALVDALGSHAAPAATACVLLWPDFVAFVNGKQKYTVGLGGHPEIGAVLQHAQAASGFLTAMRRALEGEINHQDKLAEQERKTREYLASL